MKHTMYIELRVGQGGAHFVVGLRPLQWTKRHDKKSGTNWQTVTGQLGPFIYGWSVSEPESANG